MYVKLCACDIKYLAVICTVAQAQHFLFHPIFEQISPKYLTIHLKAAECSVIQNVMTNILTVVSVLSLNRQKIPQFCTCDVIASSCEKVLPQWCSQ